jgi:uncharacterized membrane protein
MTERGQLQRICRWNRQLSGENRRLRQQLRQASQQVTKLEAVNCELRVEAEATDVLLGAALDEALRAART